MFVSKLQDKAKDIYAYADRGVEFARNVPAKLIRDIIASRQITPGIMDSMVQRHINQHYAAHDKHKASAKSNLNRAIKADIASWNTLMRFFSVIGAPEVVFTVQVKWPDGVHTYHQNVITGAALEEVAIELSNHPNSMNLVTDPLEDDEDSEAIEE